jgi:hypothetical protein
MRVRKKSRLLLTDNSLIHLNSGKAKDRTKQSLHKTKDTKFLDYLVQLKQLKLLLIDHLLVTPQPDRLLCLTEPVTFQKHLVTLDDQTNTNLS